MSKLRELVNKGVRLIVVEGAEGSPPPPPDEAEIAPETLEASTPPPISRSSVPADVEDFSSVYDEAGIALPAHGYGVDKIADMLQNKRLASLGREVKATAVLAAMEAAQVSIRDVIQDAVARDKALDAFEGAKQRELQELRTRNDARMRSLQDEMATLLRKINEELEKLKRDSDTAAQAFAQLQQRKQREEQRLFDTVAHFIEGMENPITTRPVDAPVSPAPPAKPSQP